MINRFTHNKIITAALFCGCFFVSACENDINEVRELGSKKASVDVGTNIDSYLSMSGKIKARLTAPQMLRYGADSANKMEFPQSLHVYFYNDSSKVESQLRADYGRYLENEKKTFLRGNVVAFNIMGDSLFTSELYWDQNTGKFYTDKKVVSSRSHRASLYIGIDGMECSQDLKNITFFRMQSGSYVNIPDSTMADSSRAN